VCDLRGLQTSNHDILVVYYGLHQVTMRAMAHLVDCEVEGEFGPIFVCDDLTRHAYILMNERLDFKCIEMSLAAGRI